MTELCGITRLNLGLRYHLLYFLGPFAKIAKGDYWLRHVRSSVRPHGTTRLPLDGFQ